MSPAVVPTSSQTVAHATYSNVTRTVAGSTHPAGTRPGSRIRVLIAVITRAERSNPRAKPKCLVLLPSALGFASFLRTPASFLRRQDALSDLGLVSVTIQPDHDRHERGGRPAERERATHRFLGPEETPLLRHDDVAVAEGRVVHRRVVEGDGERLELPGRQESRRPDGHLRQVSD